MNNFSLLRKNGIVICERKPFIEFLKEQINLNGEAIYTWEGTVRKLCWKNIPAGLVKVWHEPI